MAYEKLIFYMGIVFSSLIEANQNQKSAGCYLLEKGTKLECSNVGIDGRPLDVLIRQTNDYFGRPPANLTFSEMAPKVREIDARGAENKNITITKNGLADMLNLEKLSIIVRQQTPYSYSNTVPNGYLNISPNEFSNTPNLTSIKVWGLQLTDDATKAISSLKDRATYLGIIGCSPTKVVLEIADQFTRLVELQLGGYNTNGTSPTSAFRKSASTLEEINIDDWPAKKLTKAMFNGMTQLRHFRWANSNLNEIEPGAFDDLLELSYVSFKGNNFKYLPDGLFSKNKKMSEIHITRNTIQNLSSANFTHVDDYRSFIFMAW